MTLAAALVAAPLLAACLGLALGRARPGLVAPVAVAGTAVAAALAVVLAVDVLGGGGTRAATLTSVPTGTVPISVGLLLDALAAVVAVAVTAVALLVQVYSVGYLHGDPRYSSYAALVSLFTAAMLLVVLAGDLLVLYVGWEVMGICSYFLVGHYWEQHEARAAAVKAFLTTRVGDVLLLFGVFALGTHAGSFRVADVVAAGPVSTLALLLVLGGAAGKSAQFPLHVWLPDAMAGPTPVSALIHAATMVAAGVYLVLRLWPLYAADPAALAAIGAVAAITMVGSALAALAQEDLKRVLAWSTVSQLAMMFGALAVAAPVAATFHLLSHAAFKALLFLCAGSVMHAVGTALMSDMGGLRRAMPVTFLTMTLGLGALVGVPPLAGFFSKESVLTAAEEAALHGDGRTYAATAWLVLLASLATVALTAAYSTRLWLRTFFGDRRGAAAGAEAPASMRGPLVALAVPTVALGVLALPAALPRWLAELPGPAGAEAALAPAVLTTAASLALVVLPTRALGRLVVVLDRDVVHGYVRGAGHGAGLLAGAVRLTQGGNVSRYLTVLLAGVVLLAVAGAVGA